MFKKTRNELRALGFSNGDYFDMPTSEKNLKSEVILELTSQQLIQ